MARRSYTEGAMTPWSAFAIGASLDIEYLAKHVVSKSGIANIIPGELYHNGYGNYYEEIKTHLPILHTIPHEYEYALIVTLSRSCADHRDKDKRLFCSALDGAKVGSKLLHGKYSPQAVLSVPVTDSSARPRKKARMAK